LRYCGVAVNFERLDDAVRARKALNGRDVLGSDVGAIRIGFARVPVKGAPNGQEGEEALASSIQGVGDLSVGATIHALRGIKGASAVPADQQVLGGAVENYRSNLLLSMLGSSGLDAEFNGTSTTSSHSAVTEQQLIMRMLGDGSNEPEVDLSSFAGVLWMLLSSVDALLITAGPVGRIPPSHGVLHHDSCRSGANESSALGCLEASGTPQTTRLRIVYYRRD
jgi:hypothetical protein